MYSENILGHRVKNPIQVILKIVVAEYTLEIGKFYGPFK